MNREDFNRQVIVYNDIAQRLTFGLSEAGMFTNNTVYFIKAREADIQYLLAVLNSRIIDWYYRTLSVQLGEKAVRMFSIYVEQLPIPTIHFSKPLPGEEDIFMRYGLTEEEQSFIMKLRH